VSKTLTIDENLIWLVTSHTGKPVSNENVNLKALETVKQDILRWVADEIVHCKDYEIVPQTPGDIASFQHNQDAIAGSALQDYQIEILKDYGWKEPS
jgi:hypothetical protein